MPLEDVHVVAGDTQLFPFGMGTGGQPRHGERRPGRGPDRPRGSRPGPAGGRRPPGVRARDVRIEEGRAFVAGVPGPRRPPGQVARAAIRSKALRKPGSPASTCSYFYPETVTWASGTQVAVVEVDLDTCVSRLLRYSWSTTRARRSIPSSWRPSSTEAPPRAGRRPPGGGRLRRQGQLLTGASWTTRSPRPTTSRWSRWPASPSLGGQRPRDEGRRGERGHSRRRRGGQRDRGRGGRPGGTSPRSRSLQPASSPSSRRLGPGGVERAADASARKS